MAELVGICERHEYQHNATKNRKSNIRNPRKFKIRDTFWTDLVYYQYWKSIVTYFQYSQSTSISVHSRSITFSYDQCYFRSECDMYYCQYMDTCCVYMYVYICVCIYVATSFFAMSIKKKDKSYLCSNIKILLIWRHGSDTLQDKSNIIIYLYV